MYLIKFLLLLFLFTLSGECKSDAIIHEEIISNEISNFDCHTSNIIELDSNSYLAVWKGGPGIGLSNIDIKQNVGIWAAKRENNIWGRPFQIVSSYETVCWNPILLKLNDNELILFYRMGFTPRRSASFIKRSFDNGISWSEAEILPAGIYGPTLARPLLTKDGKIIAGSSISVGETSSKSDSSQATACWVEISDDRGQNWEKYGPIQIPDRHFGPIEPVLFYTKENNLAMICRDRANKVGKLGYVHRAISYDDGKHWTSFEKTNLPNPDSGLSIIDLKNGKLLLFYNHSHTNRYPLSIAISEDSGKSWNKLFDIETKSGEFPSAILDKDGLIHLTYAVKNSSDKQRSIKYIQINPTFL
jgi:predicted neuraminidase